MVVGDEMSYKLSDEKKVFRLILTVKTLVLLIEDIK